MFLIVVDFILKKRFRILVVSISLSDNAVQRKIPFMENDIDEQVFTKIKKRSIFELHGDEFSDISSTSQLMVFACCVMEKNMKKKLLLSYELKAAIKVNGITAKVKHFF